MNEMNETIDIRTCEAYGALADYYRGLRISTNISADSALDAIKQREKEIAKECRTESCFSRYSGELRWLGIRGHLAQSLKEEAKLFDQNSLHYYTLQLECETAVNKQPIVLLQDPKRYFEDYKGPLNYFERLIVSMVRPELSTTE